MDVAFGLLLLLTCHGPWRSPVHTITLKTNFDGKSFTGYLSTIDRPVLIGKEDEESGYIQRWRPLESHP